MTKSRIETYQSKYSIDNLSANQSNFFFENLITQLLTHTLGLNTLNRN